MKMALMPEKTDPDEFIIRNGRGAMEEVLNNAESLVDRFISSHLSEAGTSIDSKLKVLKPILEVLKYLDGVELDVRVKNIALRLGGIEERDVYKRQMLDVPDSEFNPYGVEYYGNVNFLKTGIIYSQAVTTVSKKYAEEILTPEFGFGLEYVLNARKEKLQGIINGVDYDIWDPMNDKEIPSQYTVDDLTGKAACKKALQKSFGLKEDAKAPLIGIVSRLADQKGFDLIAGVIEKFLKEGVQFAILGTGQKNLEEYFGALPEKFPKIAGVKIGFDNKIAHLIEAGSDMFLMPSKYEPCGLNQIYSLRYGTVPVVRGTGGLEDTIIDSTADTKNGTGFKFYDYSEGALVDALNRALDGFKSKKDWSKIQKRAMEADYSWSASARKYLELFETI